MKTDKVAGRKEPMWKRTLQNKIKELRKDLSQLEASEDNDINNFRNFGITVKRLNVVFEELKQCLF